MDGPRAPLAGEYSEVLHFFTHQLRPHHGWSMAEEYPLALSPQHLHNIRIIKDKDNGKTLSGAMVKISLLKSPAGLFKIASIGGVVTDPGHRAQGLSRAVLTDILQSAQLAGCDVAILWTDLHDFYRKLGFELAGTEISLRLEHEFSITSPLKFIESSMIEAEAIARIYGQHTCGILRTVEDIRKSLKIPNTRVYTAWDFHHQLQAYAVEGKGADLTGCIHEWGGGVSKLLPLLAHIRRVQKKPITVMTSRSSHNLIRQLTKAGAIQHTGVLGMIKILNPALLYHKIRRYFRHLGYDDFILEQRGSHTYFGFESRDLFKTDQTSDLVRLIFGPPQASDLHSFDAATAEALESVLPLPFWIWGWDSV